MAILGISTNTRLLGLAIINQEGLVDYSIHLNKSSWSPTKANMIVTSLEPCVRKYCIKKAVLSIPPKHHQTKEFRELALKIEAYLSSLKIPVSIVTRDQLLNLCSVGHKKTKKALMQSLVLEFPQLTYCYQKEMRNKNKYYVKLFEAVGVAVIQSKLK